MAPKNPGEFESLWHKVISSDYALTYLDEVSTLYGKSEGTLQYESLRFQCEMLLSEMYYKNELFEKSWIADIALIRAFSVDYPGYFNLIGRVKNTAVILDRVSEIKPFVFAFLTQSSCSWEGKIPVFGWYAETCLNDDQDSLSILTASISDLAFEMGAKLNASKSFREKVKFLVSEWERAGDALHQLGLLYQQAGNEEKQVLLEKYLRKETLKFYTEYVNKYFIEEL